MLAEPYRELLSAYVDGELSSGQRRTVQRLLDRSPEAREYLRQLQAVADNLRNLPRRRLDAEFPNKVLSAIRERNLRPGRYRAVNNVPVTMPGWISVASAAAVLLLVTATSYLVFARREQPDSGYVQGGTPSSPLPDEPKGPEPRPEPGTAVAQNDARPQPTPKATANTPEKPPGNPEPPTPSPEPEPGPIVAAPIPKLELFKPVKVPEVALPSVFSMEKLDQSKLRQELGKDSGFRLELPVQESVKAFERLRAACKSGGPSLVIDPNAQYRLDRPHLKTHIVVYTEALTPDELVRLLSQLAQEDRKAEAKKRGDGQFQNVVLTRMSKDDRKELSDLLGVDPQKMQTPKVNAPLGVDPRKPLSEGTADQILETLKGGKTTARGPERLALVLPYNPVRPRAGSVELKRFLESLRQPHPGTIQLLLVLREMKG
jgi:hypothetical protein